MNTLNDVKVSEDKLLKKGYSVKDLLGRVITVTGVSEASGDNGEYVICSIEGDDLEEGRNLVTGAQNVMARLLAAKEQDKLPVTCTVVKLGGNAFDIV